MKRLIVRTILGAIVGLVVGYFLFGEVAGVRLSIGDLIPSGGTAGIGGAIRNAAQDLVGISEVRRNILLAGAGGAGVGIVGSLFGGRRR